MIEHTRENIGESTEEKVGEATGGVAGALAGAGLGSIAGPIGTIVGGVAGAVGGWWAGEKVGRALDDWTDEDETYARTHFESLNDPAVDEYESVRPAYTVGYIAADHPDYDDFTTLEEDFRRNWTWDDYDYETLRPYVHAGYDRRRSRLDR